MLEAAQKASSRLNSGAESLMEISCACKQAGVSNLALLTSLRLRRQSPHALFCVSPRKPPAIPTRARAGCWVQAPRLAVDLEAQEAVLRAAPVAAESVPATGCDNPLNLYWARSHRRRPERSVKRQERHRHPAAELRQGLQFPGSRDWILDSGRWQTAPENGSPPAAVREAISRRVWPGEAPPAQPPSVFGPRADSHILSDQLSYRR